MAHYCIKETKVKHDFTNFLYTIYNSITPIHSIDSDLRLNSLVH